MGVYGMVALVADWSSELLGRRVSPQRGWEYLRQMRFRLRTPRPEHQEADPVEQEVWKKKLVSVVKQVQSAHPDADVEVWTMDEHRLGLKPVLRDVWVPQGEQPIANVYSGVSSGYGSMVLSTPNQGRRKEWILKRSRRAEYSVRRTRALKLISSCSIGY